MNEGEKIEKEIEVGFSEVMGAIRHDKSMALILTILSIGAWIVDVFFPGLPHGATHIGTFTNLLWIWGG